MAVFWAVASCSLEDIDRRFRGAYCFHHQGDGGRKLLCNIGATSQKTATFMLVVVRTSNLAMKHYKVDQE
jgi:hypothetical protein